MSNPTSKDLPVLWQVGVFLSMILAFWVFAFLREPILAACIVVGPIVAAWIKGLTMRDPKD